MTDPAPQPPTPDQIPKNFGCKYVAWFFWSHAVSILSIVQGVFATLSLATDMFSHNVVRGYMVANAITCAILANIDRRKPSQTETLK